MQVYEQVILLLNVVAFKAVLAECKHNLEIPRKIPEWVVIYSLGIQDLLGVKK